MKKILLSLCALALLCAPAQAQVVGMRSLGYVQMTSISAATALPSVPSGTVEAFIVCETASVRWRDDNTAPTTTVGMLLAPGTPFPYIGSFAWFQVIAVSGSPSCGVTYYGF